MEQKQLEFPLALENVSEGGSFAGYARVFEVIDGHKDVILPGAFRRTIQDRGSKIKLLWQHRMDEPIGVITELREDKRGLYVEGQLLLDVQRAQEAYALLKSGAIDGLSIGYKVIDAEMNAEGVRLIKEVELFEISLVTFPANVHAGITKIKEVIPQTIREFEQFLREAGFSRKEAKHIALGGFQQREVASEDDEYVQCEHVIEKAISMLI